MCLSPSVKGDCLLLGPRCVNQARGGEGSWRCLGTFRPKAIPRRHPAVGMSTLRKDRAMASVFKRVKEFTQSPKGKQLEEQAKEQAGKPENRRKLKEFGRRYMKRR